VDVNGGSFQSARVGVTGAGTHAIRLTAVEQALAGKPATNETIASASAAATVDDLNSDIHASDGYRRAMLKVFTRRALETALSRA
jgi:carbon-monoxide dehydrogenase medium subunit